MILIEEDKGTYADSYGEAVYTAYFTRQVYDMGNGTFLTKYGSAHIGYDRIDTYWMTLWAPNPKWYNRKKRLVLKRWTDFDPVRR